MPSRLTSKPRQYNERDDHVLARRVFPMTLAIAGLSHVGHVRRSNEDLAWWDPALGAVAVADGMGGHNAGEVAARVAMDTVAAFLQESAGSVEMTWPFGINPAWSDAANRLATAVQLANRQVLEAASRQSEWAGMGTTVVAALLSSRRLTVVGVGDSRAYLLRDGVLEQLTRDNSWTATMLDRDPSLSAAELATHPMRHVLTSVVGGAEPLPILPREREVQAGDRLLLSTDGLHATIDGDPIAEVMRHAATPDLAARELVDLALAHGGPDNVTVVVAFVGEREPGAGRR